MVQKIHPELHRDSRQQEHRHVLKYQGSIRSKGTHVSHRTERTLPRNIQSPSKEGTNTQRTRLPKFKIFQKESGILQLSTRLRDTRAPHQTRSLTPLSLKSTLTKSLLKSLHIKHLHTGTNTLLAIASGYHVPHTRSKRPSKGTQQEVPTMPTGLQ